MTLEGLRPKFGFNLAIAGFATFMGVIMLFLGVGGFLEDNEFSHEGKVVEGTVTGRHFHYYSHAGTSFELDYCYMVGKGEYQTMGKTISQIDYRALSEGDPVPIEYLASQPDESRVDLTASLESQSWGNLVGILGGIFFLVLSLVFIFASDRVVRFLRSVSQRNS